MFGHTNGITMLKIKSETVTAKINAKANGRASCCPAR